MKTPQDLALWKQHLHHQAQLLDGIDVAMCAFDENDCALVWNQAFLRLFPEHQDHVHVGEHYSENLRRFYRLRLDAHDMADLEHHVAAGVARHRNLVRPFEFSHHGKTIQVSSLPQPGLGRVRVWRVQGQPSEPHHVRAPGFDQGWELMDHVPDALLVCDQEGRVVWSNAAFRTATKDTSGSLSMGRQLEDIYISAWRRTPDDPRVAVGLATLRENLRYRGAPFELPLPHDTWCRVIGRPTRDGTTFYSLSDVTELKRFDTALQVTLENAGRGIMRFDAMGRLALYNSQVQRLLDLPVDLLNSGPTLGEIVKFQDQRGDFGENYELLQAGGASAVQVDILKDGIAEAARRRTYLRRTRAGAVLEISSQPLPDGGMVRTFSDVTAYVKTQEALLGQQNALSLTLESMAQGISAFDAEGRLVFWNRRYQELLGLPDHILRPGTTLEQLVRFQQARGDFGPDFKLVDGLARDYVAQGDRLRPLQGPETYLRETPDGLVLEVHTRPLPDGGVVRTFTDRTAVVRAQEDVARKQVLLTTLVDNLPYRVWIKDEDGAFQLSNKAHQEFHGLPESRIVGRTAHALFGHQEGERQARMDQRAMSQREPVRYEAQVRALDGSLRDMEVVKIALFERGRCTGVMGIAADITERKRAEVALIQAREEAIEASRAKTRFLSSMSHEIRTPMNAILGMLTLLRGTPLTDRQEDYAGKAEGAARSLLSLLNDVLDFSKIEAGKMQLDLHPFSLEEMLADLSSILSATVGTKEIEVLYDLDPAVPDALVGDDMRLRQILINLAGNAIKFTESGQVVLRIALCERGPGNARVLFELSDTGIGISEDDQRKLFSDYVQASTDTARRFGGTGLGLGICRRLVEMMGSRLELRSAVGVGSCFFFTLDLPLPAVVPSPSPLRDAHVLVVDDNPVAREVLQSQARTLGWQAGAAASGSEAIALVQHHQVSGRPFDVVFMDWRMPDMDGWQAALAIRDACAQGGGPAIIMVTARDRETLAQLAPHEQQGIDGFLVKPVTPAMLRHAVDRALDGPRERPQAPRSTPLAGVRLLLAEDNPVNQQIARELLAGQGAEVEVASDGAQAIAMLVTSPRFDAVLMDMLMPVMDGVQATREIRERLGLDTLPIIAMTANAMDSDRLECLAAGMNDHVGKPFVLSHVVQTVLKHTRGQVEAAGPASTPATASVDAAGLLLDRAGAVERLGSPQLFEQLLPAFAANLRRTASELRAARARSAQDEVRRIVHTLKGMASTMGAERLAGIAAQVDHQLRSGQTAAEPGIEEVDLVIAQTLEVVDQPG